MARKRDIVTRVGADTSEHDAKLARSGEVLDKFGNIGAAAGKLVAAGMVAAAAAVATLTARGIELGDALDDAAAGLGLTVDGLASLRYAAKFANVDSEQLDASLAKLARTTSMAAEGNKAAAEAFERLGLSGAELRKLPLDEQFERVADAMQGLTNDTDKARLAQDLFGRSGAKLLPLLNQGSAAIRAQRDEARSLGLTLDETQRKNIVGASDAMDKLKAAVDGAALQFAGAFGPAIEAAAGAITRLTQVVVETLPRLQALAERFFGIAAAADDLSNTALTETLHEQIRALDGVNNRVADLQSLMRVIGNENSPSLQFQLNEALEEQAEKQARINELLAERVKRQREAAVLDAAGTVTPDEDDVGFENDDQAKKDAQAELDLVTAVAEEKERVHMLELEQEAEWRQALFEAREEFRLSEYEAERALLDSLAIETQRFREEQAAADEAALKRKVQVRKQTVDNAFAGFTQITAALAAHNEKAFKLNKVAAKAEAGLNAFRAIQQVWADETLPFYAKIAATAITAAATAANIAGINKSEFGGGSVPSNLGATPVTPAGGALPDTTGRGRGGAQTIFVQGLDASAIFSGDAVRGLLERLQGALDDGGKLVIE
jgi:hypothetical protein